MTTLCPSIMIKRLRAIVSSGMPRINGAPGIRTRCQSRGPTSIVLSTSGAGAEDGAVRPHRPAMPFVDEEHVLEPELGVRDLGFPGHAAVVGAQHHSDIPEPDRVSDEIGGEMHTLEVRVPDVVKLPASAVGVNGAGRDALVTDRK